MFLGNENGNEIDEDGELTGEMVELTKRVIKNPEPQVFEM